MNSFNETNLSQQAHDLANKVADKAKGGIDRAAGTLSDSVESARRQSKPVIDQVGAAVSKGRDSAAEASDSIISYTKGNPVKALVFAAAAGALILTMIKAMTPPRD